MAAAEVEAVSEDGAEVGGEPHALEFQFTGNASEYFRIWIVNTLLTVVTLGVYSAWAKVRSRQYFYRNTRVDGSSFEYLADPLSVLKGRVIAAVALGLLFGSQHYSLTLYGIVAFALVLATPWVVVKALAFNARNSAYRNIRFAFAGRSGEAYGLYFVMLLAYVLSCGLAYPYVQWRATDFALTRHFYGDQRFSWTSKAGSYFRVYLAALLMVLPLYFAFAGYFMSLVKLGNGRAAAPANMYPVMAVMYAFLLIPGSYIKARVARLVYGRMSIGEHRLECRQRGRDLLELYVVNLLAIVCSAGLAIPWAKIRLAKYRASTLTLWASGPLRAEKLLDQDSNAIGEGMTDLGDIGFDIGI
jgi:uncharacterized membrane protein YjgN (DUF898 family)